MKKSGRALVTLFTLCMALGPFASSYGQAVGTGAPAALVIGSQDLRVEQRDDGGYHLFVRAVIGVQSILLTETTRDPSGKADNYAYRAETWNPVNGDEKRMLDGQFIDPKAGIYSLIDSTPEPDAEFGSAFHVFIPWVVQWGYSWARSGRQFIADGTFINIRAFSLPYADYAGSFSDNPFTLRVTQRPFPRAQAPAALPVPESKPVLTPDLKPYMPDTVQSFSSIADATGGLREYSPNPEDIIPALDRILSSVQGQELDLVLCLDTTESMADDIDAVRAGLPELIARHAARFRIVRFGLVLYRDYYEDYVVSRSDFTSDQASFMREVNRARTMGGRDIPEAVYEALYEALSGYAWSASNRVIVLIGDAPPHPIPRGKIDKAMTLAKAKELNVRMDVIILPH